MYIYLAVETLGTRSRLAATVASFKADVGGAEGRAAWEWAGETAPTWLLWLGRDWGEEEEENPNLLRDEEEEYGGLEGPEEEEELKMKKCLLISEGHLRVMLLTTWWHMFQSASPKLFQNIHQTPLMYSFRHLTWFLHVCLQSCLTVSVLSRVSCHMLPRVHRS